MVLVLSTTEALRITPSAAKPLHITRARPLFMQAEPPAPEEAPATTNQAPSESDGYQTYYDDERAPPKQPEISNSMRERLINESRGLGADPGSKNPLCVCLNLLCSASRLLTSGRPYRIRPSTGLSATGLKASAPLVASARMALAYFTDMRPRC